jgi:hypothetical protein
MSNGPVVPSYGALFHMLAAKPASVASALKIGVFALPLLLLVRAAALASPAWYP